MLSISCCCIKPSTENSRTLHKFSTDTAFLLNISHPMLVESEVVKPMAMDGWWYLFLCLDVIKNEAPMGRNIRCKGSVLSLEGLIQEVCQLLFSHATVTKISPNFSGLS